MSEIILIYISENYFDLWFRNISKSTYFPISGNHVPLLMINFDSPVLVNHFPIYRKISCFTDISLLMSVNHFPISCNLYRQFDSPVPVIIFRYRKLFTDIEYCNYKTYDIDSLCTTWKKISVTGQQVPTSAVPQLALGRAIVAASALWLPLWRHNC